jgi:hypothetical protein
MPPPIAIRDNRARFSRNQDAGRHIPWAIRQHYACINSTFSDPGKINGSRSKHSDPLNSARKILGKPDAVRILHSCCIACCVVADGHNSILGLARLRGLAVRVEEQRL